MNRLAGLATAAAAVLCMTACQPNDGVVVTNLTDGTVQIQSYSETKGWRDIEQLKPNGSTTIYPGLPSKDGERQCNPDADYRAVNEAGTVLLDITKVCPGDDITVGAGRWPG